MRASAQMPIFRRALRCLAGPAVSEELEGATSFGARWCRVGVVRLQLCLRTAHRLLLIVNDQLLASETERGNHP
jgi:hypothetical protein